MRNLHVISDAGFTEKQKVLCWWYTKHYNSEVGMSGQALVFKDKYYGESGRWLPIPLDDDEWNWPYIMREWRENGSPIVDVKRHIKMD